MSSFALDHHVTHAELPEKPAGQWSARRRFAALTACILAGWGVVLTPVFIWL